MSADLTPPPAPPADPTRPITLALYEADNTTPVLDFTTDLIGSRSIQTVLNDDGSVGVSVRLRTPNEDNTAMVVNPEATALTRGRIIRASVNGTVRHSGVVRARKQVAVSSNGAKAETRSVSAAGLLSEWDQAVLPPAPGTQYFPGGSTRHFGWMSAENDISGMDDAAFDHPVFQAGEPFPVPWLDLFGGVLDATDHRYFWYDDTLTDDEICVAHMAAADQITPWVNSVPMGQGALPPGTTKDQTRRGAAKLGAGVNRWAFDVTGLDGNTAPWWTCTVYTSDSPTTGQMNLSTFRFRTGYSTGTTMYPWKCSATPGGPTAKQIIRAVLTQIQSDQGLLTDWTIDGDDDTADANGNALDLIADAPFQVGVKGGSGFLAGMAAAWCDLYVAPTTKTLSVYRWRERGTFATTPGTFPIFGKTNWGHVDGRNPNVIEDSYQEPDAA